MNPIQELQQRLASVLPAAKLQLRTPRDPEGTWWLDATLRGHQVSVEWSGRRGFGVTASPLGDGYGEGPEEIFDALQPACERVRALLEARDYTHPPEKVLLRELRARMGVTQQQLADALGVKQAAVSRLERREDIGLASLRRYAAALGGSLEVHFRGPDGELRPLLAAPRAADDTHGAPLLKQLVLRCENVERSQRFYSELGFQLTREQHGGGPVHYSFTSGGQLIELYPSSKRHPQSHVRMALAVADRLDTLRRLRASGALAREQDPVTGAASDVVHDPDGNVVELAGNAHPANTPLPRIAG